MKGLTRNTLDCGVLLKAKQEKPAYAIIAYNLINLDTFTKTQDLRSAEKQQSSTLKELSI